MGQLKIKVNDLFYMTSNNWKSFKRISEEKAFSISEEESDKTCSKRAYKLRKNLYVVTGDFYQNVKVRNSDPGNEYHIDTAGSIEHRYMVHLGITLRTKNFWLSYEVFDGKIPDNAIEDKIDNVVFKKRYFKIKSKCLVTKNLWQSFFYLDDCKYYLEDKSNIFNNRICEVQNKKYYTNDFYESIKLWSKECDCSNYAFDDGGTYSQKRAKIQLLYPREKYYILFKELDRIHFAYNNSEDNTGYGKEFEIFALHRLLGLAEFEAEEHIMGNTGDGGVDAISLDGDFLCAYQIKFQAAANLKKMFIMDKNIKRLVADDFRDNELSDASVLIEYRNKHINEFKNKNYRIILIGEKIPDATVQDDQYVFYYEGNRNQEVLYKFIDCNEIINSYISECLVMNDFSKRLEITSDNMRSRIFPDETEKEVFCYMNAFDLCKAIHNLCLNKLSLDKLFMNNVRGYFGKNENIERTVINNPQKFLMFNNGVSICCSNKIKRNDCTRKMVLEKPSIVNGQQTIRTLLEIYESSNQCKLKEVTIPLFIKTCETTKERLEIAIANNKQQKVSEVDLLSADYITKMLPDVLYRLSQSKNPSNALSWLMVKINSSGAKEIDSYYECIFDESNVIELKDYFRTLFPLIYHLNGNEKLYLNIFGKASSKMIDRYVNPALDDTLPVGVKEAREKYESYINNCSDILYDVCKACVASKRFCKNNESYLPAFHIIALLLYLNKNEEDIISFFEKNTFLSKTTKEKISYVSSNDFEKSLKTYLSK